MPNALAALADRSVDRVLVAGGATQHALQVLVAIGADITVLERSGWVLPETGFHTMEVDSWIQLHDLPGSWYDAILLLGGTLESGGPWLSDSDNWRVDRAEHLSVLEDLRSTEGIVIADVAASLPPGRQYLVNRAEVGDETSLTFGAITSESGRSDLLLRSATFDRKGVLAGEVLQSRELVPIDAGRIHDWILLDAIAQAGTPQ